MLEIKEGENLSKHTTFHLGGPAKYFAAVRNKEELEEALNFAKEKKLKYFILGGGSNVLFSDAGFDGLVVRIAFMDIEIAEDGVIAGAGAPLFLAIKKAAEAGLAGLENLAGIPGTVGGAAVNNAGAYGKSISDVVSKAEILTVGPRRPYSLEAVDKSWFEYEYRASRLKFWPSSSAAPRSEAPASTTGVIPAKAGIQSAKPIILKVWFRLVKGDKEAIEQKIQEVISNRVAKEPKGFSAGCAFKNIKGEAVKEFLEKNEAPPTGVGGISDCGAERNPAPKTNGTNLSTNGVGGLLVRDNFSPDEKNFFASRGAIPAAWFIEHAELKGKKIGGAYVAVEHPNYIMNDGTAKADDALMLLSYIKQQVRDKYGVQLEEEIEIVI